MLGYKIMHEEKTQKLVFVSALTFYWTAGNNIMYSFAKYIEKVLFLAYPGFFFFLNKKEDINQKIPTVTICCWVP